MDAVGEKLRADLFYYLGGQPRPSRRPESRLSPYTFLPPAKVAAYGMTPVKPCDTCALGSRRHHESTTHHQLTPSPIHEQPLILAFKLREVAWGTSTENALNGLDSLLSPRVHLVGRTPNLLRGLCAPLVLPFQLAQHQRSASDRANRASAEPVRQRPAGMSIPWLGTAR